MLRPRTQQSPPASTPRMSDCSPLLKQHLPPRSYKPLAPQSSPATQHVRNPRTFTPLLLSRTAPPTPHHDPQSWSSELMPSQAAVVEKMVTAASKAKPAAATHRVSFDEAGPLSSTFRKAPSDPRRIRSHRKHHNTAWYLHNFDLLREPEIRILLRRFRSRAPWLRFDRHEGEAVCSVAVAQGPGHDWEEVLASGRFPTVITLPSAARQLDSSLIRVRVVGAVGLRRWEEAEVNMRILDLLDPARLNGAGGGGGPVLRKLRVPVTEKLCGEVELRGVVEVSEGTTQRKAKKFGLALEVECGMSMSKEVHGTTLRVKRLGGGRQMLALGEAKLTGRSREKFEDLNLDSEYLWFGLSPRAGRGATIRMEWLKQGGGSIVRRRGGEFLVACVDMELHELGRLRRGAVIKLIWQPSPKAKTGIRLLMVDYVGRTEEMLRVKFVLTG